MESDDPRGYPHRTRAGGPARLKNLTYGNVASGYMDLTCRGIPYIGNMSAQSSLSNTDIRKTNSSDFQIFSCVGLFYGLVTNFMAADSDADVDHTLFYKYALIQKINC